jgi:hypothetical protein
VLKREAEDCEDFIYAGGLDNDVGNLRDELRTQNRGVPVEVVRKAVEHGRCGEDASGVGEKLRQLCGKRGEH